MKVDNHPKYIQNKLKSLSKEQFGYDAFGLQDELKRDFLDYVKGYKHKYF